jgi:hypothetical protein
MKDTLEELDRLERDLKEENSAYLNVFVLLLFLNFILWLVVTAWALNFYSLWEFLMKMPLWMLSSWCFYKSVDGFECLKCWEKSIAERSGLLRIRRYEIKPLDLRPCEDKWAPPVL